ncbi:MAG TPA: DUF3795 domain-containing protein [Dehalococcoidales bacterium]|nr:DUF3795 domain-containing protein [Dehalococcoidales bacterium]
MATKNNDNAQRVKTAEEWSKQYGPVLKPEDINCGCCTSKGKMNFQYCNVCEIRKCGQEKKVKNCAYCADYTCEKLEKFFTMAPAAKANLEAIKKTR